MALIDEADYDSIRHWKWSSCRKRHTFVVYRGVLQDGRQRRIYLSRFITQTAPALFVDHKNGDGLDNRRENLRLCRIVENNRNRQRMQSTNTSGFRGVWYQKQNGNWCASMSVNNRHVHIGSFPTPEEAAAAFREAATKQYGEFAGKLEA